MSITKSLWKETTEATNGTPDVDDFLLYAPQPGTNLVTQCKRTSVANLLAGAGVLAMNTYLPAITDGSGDPVVLLNTNGPQVAQFYTVGNVMTILFDIRGSLPAMADGSFLSLDLPQPLVQDVIIDSDNAEMFWVGLFLNFAGGGGSVAGNCIFEIDMFDGYPFIDIVPAFSLDAVTKAVTGTAVDFPADPAVFHLEGQVTFQFES